MPAFLRRLKICSRKGRLSSWRWALGDQVQGHGLAVAVVGQVEQRLHGVAAAGGDLQGVHPVETNFNIVFLIESVKNLHASAASSRRRRKKNRKR
jgi:hypothetical protein